MNRRNQENIKMRALRKIVGFTCRLIRSYIQVVASGLHNKCSFSSMVAEGRKNGRYADRLQINGTGMT